MVTLVSRDWKAKLVLAASGTLVGLMLSECGFRLLKPGGGRPRSGRQYR